jgi:hypothetical protein
MTSQPGLGPESSPEINQSSMNASAKVLLCGSSLLALIVAVQSTAVASVDDAQSFALQAAEPYVKEGFQVREDYWGGDLGSGEKKAVRQQLFKGNEYWFWLGTEVERAKISVHIYDSDGKLAEEPDGWEKGHFAAAHVIPKTTGSYFVIVNVEESPEERTHWALVYGFR